MVKLYCHIILRPLKNKVKSSLWPFQWRLQERFHDSFYFKYITYLPIAENKLHNLKNAENIAIQLLLTFIGLASAEL